MKALSSILNILLFSFLTYFILSCQKDIPPPLSCDLSHPDQICREDAFRRGQFLGYVDYKYLPNNLVHQKKYYSVSHSYREDSFEYNGKNQLVYQKSTDKDGNNIEEKRIDYTEFDSVASITSLKNGATSMFSAYEYDSLNRLSFRYDYTNGKMDKSVYIYGDDGKLFSISIFDENENIISYKLFKNYLNHIIKIFEYDNKENLLTIEVIVSDNDGNIEEIRKYDNNNNLKAQETFLYVNKKLTKHAWLTGNYETEFRLFHYP